MLRYTSCHLQSITELRLVRTEASDFPAALRFEFSAILKKKKKKNTLLAYTTLNGFSLYRTRTVISVRDGMTFCTSFSRT